MEQHPKAKKRNVQTADVGSLACVTMFYDEWRYCVKHDIQGGNNMKKAFTLMLVLMIILSAVGAMGETVTLGSTGLVLNLNGLSFSKPTGADKPDHAVLMFGNSEGTMRGVVYEFASEGRTIESLENEVLAKAEGVTASGYTDLNGVQCFWVVMDDFGDNYIVYYTIEGSKMVQFEFYYKGAEAANLTGTIMNTLHKT